MLVSRRIVLLLVVGLVAAGSLVFALGASGGSRDEGNGQALLRSTLAPSIPADPEFHGITPGGVPWQLADSSVRLKTDGELDIRIVGLVIPALGTPGPVKTVSASLLCGADAQAGPTATTGQAPLSAAGDARIDATLTLPATCLAPIVVIHPNGGAARYIAVTGWTS
jgi:hypothetical protein